jgi:hypothetical protein
MRNVIMVGDDDNSRTALTVLKMRGSAHEKDIREFTIDGQGMHIGKPFRGITGILAGKAIHVPVNEIERVGGLFEEAAVETPSPEHRSKRHEHGLACGR